MMIFTVDTGKGKTMARFVEYEAVLALWDKYHYEIATRSIEFDKRLRSLQTIDERCCVDCRHFRKDDPCFAYGFCKWFNTEKCSVDCCSMWGVKDND